MAGVPGIEPGMSDSETEALPLGDTPILISPLNELRQRQELLLEG